MRLTFLGATHEVTGSCYYLEAAGKKFLVDCGMEQGPNIYENKPIPVPASQLDFVLITHAHIDHTGNLPLLYAHGFRGPIYMTPATASVLPPSFPALAASIWPPISVPRSKPPTGPRPWRNRKPTTRTAFKMRNESVRSTMT